MPDQDLPSRRPPPPEAERALAEAEARRAAEKPDEKAPRELQGRRKGLEPIRYGDWEVKGIASDF